MSRKWSSFFLAAAMIFALAVPALAAEGQEAPPMADMPQTAEIAPAAMEEAPAADMAQGRAIPMTFHGWSESVVLYSDYTAAGTDVAAVTDGDMRDTVFAGTDFSVVMAAGYGLEALAGGEVAGSHEPVDPAWAGGTEYDVHVDEDAETLELAAVCTSEGAPVQAEPEVQTIEAAPAADVPQTAEEPPVTEEVPEEVVTETAPEDAPEAAAVDQSVTVTLTGAVETIHRVIYEGTPGTAYFTDSTGTSYQILDSAGNNQSIYVAQTDSIQTQLSAIPNGEERALMGFDMRIFLENESDVTVEGAAVLKDEMDAGARCVDILLPDSGTVTVSVVAYGGAVPTVIPFTFYNNDWDNGVIVGGGSVIDGQETENFDAYWFDGQVVSGGSFEVWTAPGYEIQVLEGGSIVETRAPAGPAAADVPEGSTCFVLRVDVDASQFVIAAVKQGETFTIPEEHPATGTFKDVPDDSWYKDIVEAAYASGMVSGTSADTFSPKAAASRGDTVAMLYREAGCPALDCPVTFGDLTAEYYQDAVKWAVAIGAVQGQSQSRFAPDQAVSRQELAAMLYRMAGQPGIWAGGMMDDYSDAASIADYARGAMQWALDNGIIQGFGDGTIRPNTTATRAEVCAMLTRYNALVGRFPTEPVVTMEEEPESEVTAEEAGPEQLMQDTPTVQTGVTSNNPKLIAPKRAKIDDGLYDTPETEDEFLQQWAETYWDLDRSGEDIMWCTRYLTRMRSGPGEEYSLVWTVNNCDEVSRLGPDENGWTPVVYHEYIGAYGFTGTDYTGYVPTAALTKTAPKRPVVRPTNGPELKKWLELGADDELFYSKEWSGISEPDYTFRHLEYEPTIDGSSYIYKISGGGTVTIHNAVPGAIAQVGTSEDVESNYITLMVFVERGYGIVGTKGYRAGNYMGAGDGGMGVTSSGDYQTAWMSCGAELRKGENIDLCLVSGDEAPHAVQVTIKDNVGGSYMGSGSSRFVRVDESGSFTSDFGGENFITLRPGYKLKSASPYVSIGTVSGESHFFYLNNVPRNVDQVFVEVTR